VAALDATLSPFLHAPSPDIGPCRHRNRPSTAVALGSATSSSALCWCWDAGRCPKTASRHPWHRACFAPWQNRYLKVEGNPMETQIATLLPGSQCGQCGYAGCGQAAAGQAPVTLCPPRDVPWPSSARRGSRPSDAPSARSRHARRRRWASSARSRPSPHASPTGTESRFIGRLGRTRRLSSAATATR
jgi:hypothetical protein